MRLETTTARLSDISTLWVELLDAHSDAPEQATAAQERLMQRYRGAIHRYLLRAVGDPAAADDLTQEFALCLVRGRFRQADPRRGRFRDYLKTVLFHLVSQHRKRQQRRPRPVGADSPELANLVSPPEDLEQQFAEDLREELLSRAWDALQEVKPLFHTVLRFRVAHPQMRSPEMAKQLSEQLDLPVTAEGVRQTLRRARDKFADLLIRELAASLETPTPAEVEQSLQELDLLKYCADALARYHFPPTPA